MVAAALTAYAAGTGSEYAALTALAGGRLLVPVVAVLSNEAHEPDAAGEKVSEMALPTLVGHDGRAAVLAFTCLGSLTRWRPDARPLPVPAQRVWQAGTQEAGAVVIDVAGPVPLAVEGARLAALAGGGRAPLPHEDPDAPAAAEAGLEGAAAPGGPGWAGRGGGGGGGGAADHRRPAGRAGRRQRCRPPGDAGG